MALSKRKRFEIFSRDNFTCRYCGRRSPDVELEVDHQYPRCAGGDDEPENLVTACYDCNRGKGPVFIEAIERQDETWADAAYQALFDPESTLPPFCDHGYPERCELPRWMTGLELPPIKLGPAELDDMEALPKPFDWSNLTPAFDPFSEVA